MLLLLPLLWCHDFSMYVPRAILPPLLLPPDNIPSQLHSNRTGHCKSTNTGGRNHQANAASCCCQAGYRHPLRLTLQLWRHDSPTCWLVSRLEPKSRTKRCFSGLFSGFRRRPSPKWRKNRMMMVVTGCEASQKFTMRSRIPHTSRLGWLGSFQPFHHR